MFWQSRLLVLPAVTPNLNQLEGEAMPEAVYGLAVLLCPISMCVMMWLMMRKGGHQKTEQPTLEELQLQIDRVKAELATQNNQLPLL